MSKMPLDLNKFKKVKTDEHTSTLLHPDGHEIRIAHRRLSSKLKGQLENLPMHGQQMSEGGQVQRYAEGTDDVGDYEMPPMDEPRTRADKSGDIELNPFSGAGEASSQQAYDESMASLPKTPGEAAAREQPPLQGVRVASTDPYAGMEELGRAPASEVAAPSNQGETLLGPATMKPAVAQDPYGQLGSVQKQISGMEKVGAGQAAEAKVAAEQAKINLANEQTHLVQQKKLFDDFQTAQAPLIKARDELLKDINEGHINPQHYVDNMTTGGKIRTAIGLILGGMGSGLTGGPNLAFNYLQKQIDNDIDSQKSNISKKETLLNHNLKLTGDLREAYSMTKMQNNDILASQLRMTADQTADPLAKAKLLQIAGMTDQKTAELQQQMAMTKMRMGAMSGGGASDPAKLVPMLVPKEHQATAFKEIQAAENTHKMGSSIIDAFEQAVKENTVLRTGAGMLRTPGSVYALHQHMQPTFQDLEGTVRQAAMDNTFKNVTPLPGDSEHKIEQKRQALQEYLKSKMSAPTARGYGIDLSQYERTTPAGGEKKQPGQIRFTKAQ